MKKSLFASGFIGAVASLLGVVAVGCSAETGAPEAEIGSTEQAIGLNLTESYDVAAYNAKFPAYIKLASGDLLVVGGYDASSGSATNKIRKVSYNSGTSTVTWSRFLSGGGSEVTLNTGRGEAEIAEIPGQSGKYLVVGGRTGDGGTRLASAEIIDTTGTNLVVTAVTDTLASVRVNFGLTKCGDHLLISGGDENGASSKLEVFTYNATPANSTFDLMDNADPGTTTVALTSARMFHGALALPAAIGGSSVARIILFGGEASGALSSTETLDVNSSCQFMDNDGDTNTKKAVPHTGPAMPAARSQFAAAQRSVVVNVPGTGNVTHEAIAAGGYDGNTTVVTGTIVYDDNATPGSAVWRSGPALSSAHVRPSFAEGPNGDFALVGGLSGMDPSVKDDVTTVEVDVFSDSGDSFSNPSDLTESRIGAWAGYFSAAATPAYLAGQGEHVVYAGGPPTTRTATLLQSAE